MANENLFRSLVSHHKFIITKNRVWSIWWGRIIENVRWNALNFFEKERNENNNLFTISFHPYPHPDARTLAHTDLWISILFFFLNFSFYLCVFRSFSLRPCLSIVDTVAQTERSERWCMHKDCIVQASSHIHVFYRRVFCSDFLFCICLWLWFMWISESLSWQWMFNVSVWMSVVNWILK